MYRYVFSQLKKNDKSLATLDTDTPPTPKYLSKTTLKHCQKEKHTPFRPFPHSKGEVTDSRKSSRKFTTEILFYVEAAK